MDCWDWFYWSFSFHRDQKHWRNIEKDTQIPLVMTDFIGPSVFIQTKNIEKILIQKTLVLSFYLYVKWQKCTHSVLGCWFPPSKFLKLVFPSLCFHHPPKYIKSHLSSYIQVKGGEGSFKPKYMYNASKIRKLGVFKVFFKTPYIEYL